MTAQPNIIVIDDLRFDEFGVTGHPYMAPRTSIAWPT